MGILFGEGSLFESLSNPDQWWERFRNGRTNTTNKQIANENLAYQRERNAIDDARYEEERDYQRALQQQIFEREDTAFSRQAEDLARIGINPISQGSLNGAGAGQGVVSQMSTGGQALHNDFQMQDQGALTPILSLLNGINNISTSGFQRDLLSAQADAQRLKNQEQALINASKAKELEQAEELRQEEIRHKKEQNPSEEKSAKAKANRDTREDIFQETYGGHDTQSTYNAIATDMAMQADRAYNYSKDQVGGYSKSALQTLKDNADEAVKAYGKVTSNIQNGIISGLKAGKDKLKNAWKNRKKWSDYLDYEIPEF